QAGNTAGVSRNQSAAVAVVIALWHSCCCKKRRQKRRNQDSVPVRRGSEPDSGHPEDHQRLARVLTGLCYFCRSNNMNRLLTRIFCVIRTTAVRGQEDVRAADSVVNIDCAADTILIESYAKNYEPRKALLYAAVFPR